MAFPQTMRTLRTSTRSCRAQSTWRLFHTSRRRDVVKPFLLADIGEGTRECQVIQWFVKPGARVEQFDKLCEVQSDKTASDITSPFDGVIKKLYYEADDMALVGKPLLDIDIQSEISPEDEALLDTSGGQTSSTSATTKPEKSIAESVENPADADNEEPIAGPLGRSEEKSKELEGSRPAGKHQSLATPAVRHLTKEMKVKIEDIQGTGKDGRVLKEDVHRHVARSTQSSNPNKIVAPVTGSTKQAEEDKIVSLTPVQKAMFKTMTRSLTIPHFLYTNTVDMSVSTALRNRINKQVAKEDRFTPLPFIMKAISLAFARHPLLNASLDTTSGDKPVLTYRASHNFGVAVDTPSGLMVPVVHNVEQMSVTEIAAKIRSISATAREGRLSPADMHGATFSISNIGSVGGGVVAPIIVEPQVAIVGVGRSRIVPAFNDEGALVKREELVMSWSADHRVVDGAECARCAERVKDCLENTERWLLELR